MLKPALLSTWPLAIALLLVCGALATLVRLLRPGTRQPLLALHADQRGSVQSLSFVLTVPIFIMLMLLAVQITQLMIGLIVVQYAAFAAARSASVWIPERFGNDSVSVDREGQNRIGLRDLVGRRDNGTEYLIEPGTPKYEKARQAAALACLSIAPSRDLGLSGADAIGTALQNVFATFAPREVATNSRLPRRLANKWAYANAATNIEMRVFHRDDEPPLIRYFNLPNYEFTDYEIGWRDEITVKVTHNFALLPGPGRLLAQRANQSVKRDTISPMIQQKGNVYYLPLTAAVTLVPEGEKSRFPYVHEEL